MSESVISLKGVRKSYGQHEVLKGVDLEIEKGYIYGLLGRNGSGKSTIFKIILGLSDYNEGEVYVAEDTKSSKGNSEDEPVRRIGFLIGNNFFSYMTARQNLTYYAKLKGIKDKKEIDRVLEIVNLKDVNTKAGGFSLGMKQRLGIANALLGNPDILILDEPTNGLDPQGIADIRNLIQKLNKETGMTVLISSHILGELQNTANRFAILNDGIIAKTLTQEELTTKEKSIKIKVNDLDKAVSVLKNNGIEILDTEKETLSLEDFYFSLIGGSNE